MVEEINEPYEGQDEGEYHFSDDQGYETERGSVPEDSQPKMSWRDIFQKYKRIIIAVPVFFILIFVVYEFLLPGGGGQNKLGEFKAPAMNPKTPMMAAAPKPEPNKMPMAEMAQPTAPVVEMASPVPSQPMVQPVQPAPQQQPVAEQDKLTEVAQQNAKLMSMLQEDYQQRMAALETQNKDLQGKVDNLNTRLSAIETGMGQLTQLLQGLSKQAVAPTGMRSHLIKIPYTVQAIIPGRAWLKSESGDTITVAEGDMLKGVGRVTKIDPYDGVVDFDTGNKVISLTYGGSGE